MATKLLDALDWQLGDDATLSCPLTWHGEAGELVLELGGPGPATLSLVGITGTLWTRELERPTRR